MSTIKPGSKAAYYLHLCVIAAYIIVIFFPAIFKPRNESGGFLYLFLLVIIAPPIYIFTIASFFITLILSFLDLKEWPLLILSLLFFAAIDTIVFDKDNLARIFVPLYMLLALLFSAWRLTMKKTPSRNSDELNSN